MNSDEFKKALTEVINNCNNNCSDCILDTWVNGESVCDIVNKVVKTD